MTGEFEPITHTVVLSKGAQKQLQEDKINAQIAAIIQTVQTGARTARGWSISAKEHDKPWPQHGTQLFFKDYNRSGAIEGEYLYKIVLNIECTPKTQRTTLDSEFATICNAIDSTASQPQRGKWRVTSVDSKPWSAVTAIEQNTSGDVGYAPLQMPDHDEFLSYFSHLYGLESHITIVESSIRRALTDNFQKRFHCALIGPPGCGKSDICQSLKKALGEESVLEFDATSTTMAGAQKELAEREELPRVIVIEEIEKIPVDSSAAWMLSVLDLRGEIRKTTARGNILKDTRMFAVATVNDEDRFLTMNSGALASRFMNKVHFKRPAREIMEKIILREIKSSNGNPAWAEPTLDYMEEAQIEDIREVIAIALCGADGLLDGSYQKHLRNVRRPNWENGK